MEISDVAIDFDNFSGLMGGLWWWWIQFLQLAISKKNQKPYFTLGLVDTPLETSKGIEGYLLDRHLLYYKDCIIQQALIGI